MFTCPYCGVEILEGMDECEQCGQTLTDLSLPVPATPVEEDLLTDTVQSLSPNSPCTVRPDLPVGDALRLMVRARVGCLMVVDDEKLVGIFSERDAMMKLNVDAARLAKQPILRFMTPNPETVTAKDKIAIALRRMSVGGYRHLPILADGKLCGVISIRDVLDYLTARMAASRSA